MEQDDGRGGALVEEAKRLMKEDEENEKDATQENSGPKIKMGRLGGKKKKGDTSKGSAAPGAKVDSS
jgi:hypothetical protein